MSSILLSWINIRDYVLTSFKFNKLDNNLALNLFTMNFIEILLIERISAFLPLSFLDEDWNEYERRIPLEFQLLFSQTDHLSANTLSTNNEDSRYLLCHNKWSCKTFSDENMERSENTLELASPISFLMYKMSFI